MNVFIFDQTFEGLLSVIFDAFRLKTFPDALLSPQDDLPLLAEKVINVETENEKVERVWGGLRKKLSSLAIRHIMYVWMSEQRSGHELIIRYARKIFSGVNETNFADPDVLEMKQLAATVSHEHHRLLQFICFQKTTEGMYFAAVKPLYNVLPLVIDFFKDRFSDQKWLIFDLIRGYGIYYDLENVYQTGECPPVDFETGRLEDSLLAEDENLYQEAWTRYFESIAITERANPRLQKQFMPKRFWPMLTEKQAAGRGKNLT